MERRLKVATPKAGQYFLYVYTQVDGISDAAFKPWGNDRAKVLDNALRQ